MIRCGEIISSARKKNGLGSIFQNKIKVLLWKDLQGEKLLIINIKRFTQ